MMYSFKKLLSTIHRRQRQPFTRILRTQHEMTVLFWERVVAATCAGFMVVIIVSLSMWWVVPQHQDATDVLLPDEELPEQTGDGYDVSKAEKVIQFYLERQNSPSSQ